MTMQKHTVRKINLFPLAKFGCLLGGLMMFIPANICAIVAVQVVGQIRQFLDDREILEYDPLSLGIPIEFDYIDLLGLQDVQQLLIQLDDQSATVATLIILGGVIGGGLIIGLTILLVGWCYNILAALTGGIEIELQQ